MTDASGNKPSAALDAEQMIAKKARWKPQMDSFPQIIQASDSVTIQAIELLYSELASLTPGEQPPEGVGQTPGFSVKLREREILLSNARSSTSVRFSESNVTVARRQFDAAATVELFQTLHRVLSDVSARTGEGKVLATQYPTSAYHRYTHIEFVVAPLVVQLEALSNGPQDEERLYILDLVHKNDSVLWLDGKGI